MKGLEKYFMNINSFMHFQVGLEVVNGGPLLVQPRVSRTEQIVKLYGGEALYILFK